MFIRSWMVERTVFCSGESHHPEVPGFLCIPTFLERVPDKGTWGLLFAKWPDCWGEGCS